MNQLRVEFHCHTRASKDSLVKPEILVATCRRKGIDRVVITDHNSMEGAWQAQALDPERVIPGEEIMTQQGELIGIYMTEEIPPGLPSLEVIERLRAQGAVISVSHPFDTHRGGGWKLPNLQQIAPLVDAVEIFNARCLLAKFNDQAQDFAKQYGLLGTAGSDAHTTFELGAANLLLPFFQDAPSLITALPQGELRARLLPFWVHLFSRYASIRKKI